MPRLCEFYGIVIYMYRPDHPPAHFHARYGDQWAQVSIVDGRVIAGEIPQRAVRLVQEWVERHRTELVADWELAQMLEPLVPIDPLP